MTTQLLLYNEASRLLGAQKLADLTVDEELRLSLDDVYTQAVTYCMSQGWWRFAMASTAPSTSSSTAVAGYTYRFSKPSDWLRTHSVLVTNGTRTYPVDWFESGDYIYCKYSTVALRYTQDDIAAADWPEVFAKMVAAYLAFEVCQRITQNPSLKGDLWNIYQQRLALCAASEAITSPLKLPEHAVEFATRHLLEQGWWRFAMKTADLVHDSGLTATSDFSYRDEKPADWLRTYGVYVAAAARTVPSDYREFGTVIHFDYSPARLQYVSSDYINPTTWPEGFRQAVDAYLMLESVRAEGSAKDAEAAKAQYDRVLDQALSKDTLPRPMNYPEGSIRRCARLLLEQGWWRFAMKTATLSHNAAVTASPNFSYRANKPADWMRTYAVTVASGPRTIPSDYREVGSTIHFDFSTVRLQYVSSDYLSPATWTEGFWQCVDAYLALEAARASGVAKDAEFAKSQYDKVLNAALVKDGLPRPMLVAEGTHRRCARAMLEEAAWKFATKTVRLEDNEDTRSAGYSYTLDKPTDWVRSWFMFRLIGQQAEQIDYRDEDGMLYANYSPVYLRYVSSDGLDPANWTELFTRAWLAMLRYEEAKENGMSEGEVQARFSTWRQLLREAAIKDALNERPVTNRAGQFTRARRGSTYRTGGGNTVYIVDESGNYIEVS